VEVAADGDLVYVRDSKNPNGPVLTFDPGTWVAFVESVKEYRFDR
jgi:hypothetical protein